MACDLKEHIFEEKIEHERLKQTQSSYSFSTQVVTVVYIPTSEEYSNESIDEGDLLSA